MPEDLVQEGKEVEFGNLEWFKVYNWIRTNDLPEGAKIRDTVWALKRRGLGVRARLCLRDFKAMDKKLEGVFSPTPTPLTVRVILFFATVLDLELAIGDLTTAFMHAESSAEMYCYPPEEIARPGWVWKLNKAINTDSPFLGKIANHLKHGFSKCGSVDLENGLAIFYSKIEHGSMVDASCSCFVAATVASFISLAHM